MDGPLISILLDQCKNDCTKLLSMCDSSEVTLAVLEHIHASSDVVCSDQLVARLVVWITAHLMRTEDIGQLRAYLVRLRQLFAHSNKYYPTLRSSIHDYLYRHFPLEHLFQRTESLEFRDVVAYSQRLQQQKSNGQNVRFSTSRTLHNFVRNVDYVWTDAPALTAHGLISSVMLHMGGVISAFVAQFDALGFFVVNDDSCRLDVPGLARLQIEDTYRTYVHQVLSLHDVSTALYPCSGRVGESEFIAFPAVLLMVPCIYVVRRTRTNAWVWYVVVPNQSVLEAYHALSLTQVVEKMLTENQWRQWARAAVRDKPYALDVPVCIHIDKERNMQISDVQNFAVQLVRLCFEHRALNECTSWDRVFYKDDPTNLVLHSILCLLKKSVALVASAVNAVMHAEDETPYISTSFIMDRLSGARARAKLETHINVIGGYTNVFGTTDASVCVVGIVATAFMQFYTHLMTLDF